MNDPEEPPQAITLSVEEALDVLAVLEEARESFYESDFLGGVIGVEDSIRMLSRKLGFNDPEGRDDGL